MTSRFWLAAGLLFMLACTACASCPSTSNDVPDAGCTYYSCDDECRQDGQFYASCSGGQCHCQDAWPLPDADVVGDVPDATDGSADDGGEDARREDAAPDEATSDDAAEVEDGASDCAVRAPGETRLGASPGVVCTRVSTDRLESGLLFASADRNDIVFTNFGATGIDNSAMWHYDRPSGCLDLLEDGSTAPERSSGSIWNPSVDQDLVAWGLMWYEGAATQHCQLRLTTIGTAGSVLLDENVSAEDYTGFGCQTNYIALDYPWVVWRDIREADGYRWYVLALNIETGERRNLSIDPPDGSDYWSARRIDLLGATVVWGGVGLDTHEKVVSADLATGVRTVISEDLSSRWFATITPDWIAWIDQRNHPECWWFAPCSSDIYGYDRATGEVRALVVAGETMQGDEVDGEGPWLVYEDQRDGGGDENYDLDREEDIFALYLPTMTEIRITDWPGYELTPRAYQRSDGTYGVLVPWEISRTGGDYRLWDCDLPTPAGGDAEAGTGGAGDGDRGD